MRARTLICVPGLTGTRTPRLHANGGEMKTLLPSGDYSDFIGGTALV